MFSEHHEIAKKIREVVAKRIDDRRKAYSLEVNVLSLKTFEILLMDRQAIIGVDEAQSIVDGDESVIQPLVRDLCRQVHTILYDRRKHLIHTRQLLYSILAEAGLDSQFKKEFLSTVYEEKFKEEEKSDDRSKIIEVALEVEWLKLKTALALQGIKSPKELAPPAEDAEKEEPKVTVDITDPEGIQVDIPETS